MRLKTTCLLLVVLLAMAGGIVWLTQSGDGQPSNGKHKDGAPSFVVPDAVFAWAKATRVTVNTPDAQQPFVFEKRGPIWWQTEPALAPLKQVSGMAVAQGAGLGFDDWLAKMQSATVQGEQPVDTATLSRVGLAAGEGTNAQDAAATICVQDSQGQQITIRTGNVRLGTGYVQVFEQPANDVTSQAIAQTAILRTGDVFAGFVAEHPYQHLRSTSLAPAPIHRTTHLTIQRPDGQFALTKVAGLWRLQQAQPNTRLQTHALLPTNPAHGDLLDRTLIQQALDRLIQSQILAWPDDAPTNLKDHGLSENNGGLEQQHLDMSKATSETIAPTSGGGGLGVTVVFDTPVDEGDGQAVVPSVLRLGRPANLEATAYLATWSPMGQASNAVIALPMEAVAPWLVSIDQLRLRRLVPDTLLDVATLTFEQPNSAGETAPPLVWTNSPEADKPLLQAAARLLGTPADDLTTTSPQDMAIKE